MLAVAALLVGGCAGGPAGRPSVSPQDLPPPLVGLPTTVVDVGEVELLVAIADTPGARSRGLMGVDDFGLIEGMVFVFDAPSENGFFMKDVPVPLDIAFVGADRTVLAVLTMAVCPADPCPTYRSPAPFTWAVEAPAGVLADVAPGDPFSMEPAGQPASS